MPRKPSKPSENTTDSEVMIALNNAFSALLNWDKMPRDRRDARLRAYVDSFREDDENTYCTVNGKWLVSPQEIALCHLAAAALSLLDQFPETHESHHSFMGRVLKGIEK